MKILHFSLYGSEVGGVESYIADVSAALKAAGHASQLVSFAPEETSHLMSGTVQVVAPDLPTILTGIARTVADFRPDVAYLHAIYQPEIVRWIADRLPAVAYVHGPYLVCPGNAQYLRRSRQVCPHAASPGCLLHAQTERCCFGRNPIRHWRRLREVYTLIATYRDLDILVGSRFMQGLLERNGLAPQRINTLAPFLVDASQPEATMPGRNTVLYAGRLVPEKGLAHLIQALAGIPQEWRLMVAGDGPSRKVYEELATQLGVSERVSFLGWLKSSQMMQIYKGSSFVVVPSLWPEPFGRIGPEAAVQGRAAVAYDVGGVPDWLVDGVTGYLVPPGDISLLRERIMELLRAPAQQIEMGRRARELALARWNSTEHVHRLLRHMMIMRS